jgi:hypothetical protein
MSSPDLPHRIYVYALDDGLQDRPPAFEAEVLPNLAKVPRNLWPPELVILERGKLLLSFAFLALDIVRWASCYGEQENGYRRLLR